VTAPGAPRADATPDLASLGARSLLIVLDYDGTLAPIVTRPEHATPEAGASEAVTRLTLAKQHAVAVLTGRPAHEVEAFLRVPDLTVVGLHGMAWPGEPLMEPDEAALQHLRQHLPDEPGLRLEDKRWTLAAHYREVPPERQAHVEAALAGVPLPSGWEVVPGKMVREYRPAGFGKGRAVRRLASQHPQHVPVFIGDDVTDEEGFDAVLALRGVAVKVGEGTTRAPHRLSSPADVVALLNSWAAHAG